MDEARGLQEIRGQRGGVRRGRRVDPKTHSHLHSVVMRETHEGLKGLVAEFGCSSIGEAIDGLYRGYRGLQARQREKRVA